MRVKMLGFQRESKYKWVLFPPYRFVLLSFEKYHEHDCPLDSQQRRSDHRYTRGRPVVNKHTKRGGELSTSRSSQPSVQEKVQHVFGKCGLAQSWLSVSRRF